MSEIFKRLSSIDVSAHAEKKQGLTYLSWTWAWAELMKVYPSATYEIKRNSDGLPFVESSVGYMVFTTVTIENLTHEMFLPVMNSQNKAMKREAYEYTVKAGKRTVEPCSMFDVNKTIMRCLVKNIAMFGLGVNIYAGEDLPVTNPLDDPINKEKADNLSRICQTDSIREFFLSSWKIDSFMSLNVGRYESALAWIPDAVASSKKHLIETINSFPFKAVDHKRNSFQKYLGTLNPNESMLEDLENYIIHLKEKSKENEQSK